MASCTGAARLVLALIAACAVAYSPEDATADHTAAAIDFAEAGGMDSAVASFRAATVFAPDVPEHWYNLAEALSDEGWGGSTAAAAKREATAARVRHRKLTASLGGSSQTAGEQESYEGLAASAAALATVGGWRPGAGTTASFYDTPWWDRNAPDGRPSGHRVTGADPRKRFLSLPRAYSDNSAHAGALAPHRAVICGIIRDKADLVPQLQRNLEGLGSLFADYRVILSENDSQDGTFALLEKWAAANPKVTVLKGDDDGPAFARKPRHVRYIKYRNSYLKEFERRLSPESPDHFAADLMIATDTDFLYDFELGGIVAALRHNPAPAWDVLCAHSTHRNANADATPADSLETAVAVETLYDVVAYRDAMVNKNAFDDGGQRFLFKRLATMGLHRTILYGGARKTWPMVPVTSCFSGLAIYRIAAFVSGTGDSDSNPELECKYSCKKIAGAQAGMSVCDCEHVPFTECVAARGGNGAFVHPLLHVHAPKITTKDKAMDGEGTGYDEALPGAAVAGGSTKFLPSEIAHHGAENAAYLGFSFFAELMAGGDGFTFWERMVFAVNAIRAAPSSERAYRTAANILHKHGRGCDAAQIDLWARGFSAAGNADDGPDLCKGAISFGAREVRAAVDGLVRLPPWYDGLADSTVREVVREVYSDVAYA